MTSHYLLLLLCASLSLQMRRPPPASVSDTTAADADDADDVDEYDDADDDYVTLVKGYIDAGTCDATSANTNCGDSATSYYNEFEYNGQRVIIANGIPDHTAESDALKSNPNTRCETWTYMSVPIDPTKVSFCHTIYLLN